MENITLLQIISPVLDVCTTSGIYSEMNLTSSKWPWWPDRENAIYLFIEIDTLTFSYLCMTTCGCVCVWKLRVRMSNGGLNPKSRIHPERVTQAYQWSHWYMKGHDGWRECVRECECMSVLEWVCVQVCEGKRFTRTNLPDVECQASFRRSCLPGSRPQREFNFSMTCRHLTRVFLQPKPFNCLSFHWSLI